MRAARPGSASTAASSAALAVLPVRVVWVCGHAGWPRTGSASAGVVVSRTVAVLAAVSRQLLWGAGSWATAEESGYAAGWAQAHVDEERGD